MNLTAMCSSRSILEFQAASTPTESVKIISTVPPEMETFLVHTLKQPDGCGQERVRPIWFLVSVLKQGIVIGRSPPTSVRGQGMCSN